MKIKTTITTITVFALATVLLTSGFVMPSAEAQKSSSVTKVHVVSSTLDNHSVIFKYCAGDTSMRAPEVIITSDSQVKKVSLNKHIAANTCKTTAANIKALDVDTIKLKKVDKSNLNKMITSAEKRLTNIKNEISIQNDNLEELLASLPGGSGPEKSTNVKKINEITEKLSELREKLKDARSEYYRLLYVLRG